jgi:hypothetical protein
MKLSSRFLLVFCVLSALPAASQSNPLLVNLLKDDQYVTRIMRIFKKSGEKTNGAANISFDPQAKTLLIRDVIGNVTRIPATNIDHIEFVQEKRRQNPAAQSAPWKILASPSRRATYKIPEESMKLEMGVLTLQPSWEQPVHEALINTVSSEDSADLARINASRTPAQEIAEPVQLKYDPATKSFQIDLQYIKYYRLITGSSGGRSGITETPGIITKPLQ